MPRIRGVQDGPRLFACHSVPNSYQTKGRFAMSTGTAVWKGPVETASGLLATSDMV